MDHEKQFAIRLANKMYKQVVVISLLAAAATSFPSSTVNDLGPTLQFDGNDSIEKSVEAVQKAPKSLILIALTPGIPDELIEESADSKAKTRTARDCLFTFARDCSVKAVNLTAVYEQDQKTLQQGLDTLADNRDTSLQKLDKIIDLLFASRS